MSEKIDVSRQAVEAECDNLSGPAFYHTRALLRALLDRAEKAEADNARLRRAVERKDYVLVNVGGSLDPEKQPITIGQIYDAIAYTGTDDREQAERDYPPRGAAR